MINLDLENQIAQQIEQTISSYLDSEQIKSHIQEQINKAIGGVIEKAAEKVYFDLIQNSNLPNTVKLLIKEHTIGVVKTEGLNEVRRHLSEIPVKNIIDETVKKELNYTLEHLQFPTASIDPASINWKAGTISGSSISDGIIRNFSSTGIEDRSSKCQLTILDDHVVTEGEFTALHITADQNINATNISLTGTLEIGTDIIDHGPLSNFVQTHAEIVTSQMLDAYRPLVKDGVALVSGDTIDSSVVLSNLRRVGNLMELNVLGDSALSDTLFVSKNNRVGINTDSLKGALTIVDQDAELNIVKNDKRSMYVGTTNSNNFLSLGTDNTSQIDIKPNEITITTPINFMGFKLAAMNKVPEHSGNLNDIILVSDTKPNQPFVYICRGGNIWHALTF